MCGAYDDAASEREEGTMHKVWSGRQAAGRIRRTFLAASGVLAALAIVAGMKALAAEVAGAPGAGGGAESERSPCFTIIARSPVRSISEYYVHIRREGRATRGAANEQTSVEMRTGDGGTRVGWLPSILPNYYSGGGELTERQLRALGKIADGEYLLAVTSGGKRISNVTRLKVDSRFEVTKEPAVRLVSLPTVLGSEFPQVEYIVTGPMPEDKRLTEWDGRDVATEPTDLIRYPVLIIDGVATRVRGRFGTGNTRARPGERYEDIIRLSEYLKEPSGNAQYRVKAKLLEYESAEVTVPADGRLEEEWDRKSATVAERPAPMPLLTGKVIGPDGKPAAGYEVGIGARGNMHFGETAGPDGSYRFVNVPPGVYRVGTNPPGSAVPSMGISGVEVQEGKQTVQDLNMGKYTLSGTITFSDGTPGAGIELRATFESEDGRIEFENIATTDAKGRYEFKTPAGVVTYIEPYVDEHTERARPKSGMKAGEGDVDFILYRKGG